MSLLLLSLCLPLAIGHTCIHDQMAKVSRTATVWQDYSSGRFHGEQAGGASSEIAPLRIKVFHLWQLNNDPYQCKKIGDEVETLDATGQAKVKYTCDARDILDNAKRDKLVSDVARAVDMHSAVLYVNRTSKNLVFDKQVDCQPLTSFFPIVDPSHWSTGVADADFVLYITVRPTPPGVLAFAIACQHDQFGRPTMGTATWGARNIDVNDTASHLIALHEMTHALGFSSDGFSRFRDPNNFNGKPLDRSKVLQTFTMPGANGRVVEVTRMITPKVREVVQRHFQCPSLEGAEIEGGGGSGTAGSHWEKRVFDNEVMTGSKSPNSLMTKLTYAALQDSGLYDVDFTSIPDLQYGARLGCAFPTSSCGDWFNLFPNYVCKDERRVENQPPMCSVSRNARAYCNACEYNIDRSDCRGARPPPSQYQYFPNPNIGGRSETADYCPLVTPYDKQASCALATSANDASPIRGEIFSASSLCFISSLAYIGKSTYNLPPASVCHEWACSGPILLIKLLPAGAANAIFVQCKVSGTATHTSFTGSITCPDPKDYCDPNAPVPTDNSATPGTADKAATIGTPAAVPWPEIDRVEPRSGGPGTTISVIGRNFSPDCDIDLDVNNGCNPVSYKSSTLILCTLPPLFVIGDAVQVDVVRPNPANATEKLTASAGASAFKVVDQKTLKDTIGDGLNAAAAETVSTWKKINSACGKNFPCWAIPVILACVGLLILYWCCCQKKKPKPPPEKPHEQQHQQPRQAPPKAPAGGNPYAAKPPPLKSAATRV